jgi:23S rRNA pseudouridine955/2504/2580 synthase
VVRIPPLSFTEKTIKQPSRKLNPKILFEDEWFIVVDKPSGLAVHGGSGIDFGLIEYLRNDRSDSKFLELVHRLDKNTSGILLIAKKRSALRSLQELFRLKKIKKNYFVGVHGIWTKKRAEINSILQKINTKDGHHVNVVNDLNIGKLSKSVFYLIKCVENFSLLSVHLITGRTHQIRVQLAHEGFPVLGDDKYGDFNLNKELKRVGLKRMFLHAHKISFQHPFTEDQFECESELPQDLSLIFNE